MKEKILNSPFVVFVSFVVNVLGLMADSFGLRRSELGHTWQSDRA
jgi:hypothetical protein